jgi:hypothetical protein
MEQPLIYLEHKVFEPSPRPSKEIPPQHIPQSRAEFTVVAIAIKQIQIVPNEFSDNRIAAIQLAYALQRYQRRHRRAARSQSPESDGCAQAFLTPAAVVFRRLAVGADPQVPERDFRLLNVSLDFLGSRRLRAVVYKLDQLSAP